MSRINLPTGLRSYRRSVSDDSFDNSGMLTRSDQPNPTVSDDGETPLPPTLANEAGPYLRKIFAIMRDPKVTGRGKSAEFGVPVHLQGFVSAYLAERGHRIKFSMGQLTKKHYVTVLTAGE